MALLAQGLVRAAPTDSNSTELESAGPQPDIEEYIIHCDYYEDQCTRAPYNYWCPIFTGHMEKRFEMYQCEIYCRCIPLLGCPRCNKRGEDEDHVHTIGEDHEAHVQAEE